MTVGQWKREGRKVRAPARKAAAVVPWNGRTVRVFAERQTYLRHPKPETVAFRNDGDQLLDFVNPRRDLHQWGFTPRRQLNLRPLLDVGPADVDKEGAGQGAAAEDHAVPQARTP